MADTEQLERVIGLAWVVALPVTVLWTFWAMHQRAHQRMSLAALLFVALPGALIGLELVVHGGPDGSAGSGVNAYDFVGVPLSFLWLLVGPLYLVFVRLGPVERRAPWSLTVAHAGLWALTTLVALRFAVGV